MCCLLVLAGLLQDLLLRRLARLLPAGTIEKTTMQLVHNVSSIEEAKAGEPSLFNTGLHNIKDIWQVSTAT
jgi:hypothetical protein